MKNYSVEVKPTTRESIVKFEVNDFLANRENYEFANIEEAQKSPLAQQLFHLPFVKTVYISQNFVAVEKFNIVEWKDVQEEMRDSIQKFLNDGGVVIKETEKTTEKIPVTVYAESTPNPAVLKFVANKKLVLEAIEFKSIDEAKSSKLAQQLFHFPFVKEVFIDSNYISIQKYDIAEWEEVANEIRGFIKSFLEENETVVDASLLAKNDSKKEEQANSESQDFGELDDTSQQIISILDEYVKPAVASDGGNIMFDSYNETSKEVKVILQGACSGCPSSTMTLKNGIETMLRDMLNGKVNSVVAING
ncbi:MAG: NifU family protein [Bacteroidota bacterium]